MEQVGKEMMEQLQHTNKNLEGTKLKVQETFDMLYETNKKVDMIMDLLFTNNADRPRQESPAANVRSIYA